MPYSTSRGAPIGGLYDPHPDTPPRTELHREMSARLLGNGYCTRPRQLNCVHDSACENCVHFRTTIAFRPVLQAQHDDATAKSQTDRQHLLSERLDRIDHNAAS